MPCPIVIAHHLMWTAYGFWLPNDPRGSTSKTIGCDAIAELGEIHYGRRTVQPAGQAIRDFRRDAVEVLKFPLLEIQRNEVSVVAQGLADAISQHRYTCYACAVMPDHVHILIRKHKHQAEEMLEHLKNSSRSRLSLGGLRTPDHPVWTEGGWKVFLDTPAAVREEIRYIEGNPLKWRLPVQKWPFVTPYDGWPLGPGHNPNSPYARRLRGRYREEG